MVEVFKTDVRNKNQAQMLLHQIHTIFRNYKANFDLEDCDNILRIQTKSGEVMQSAVVELLKDFGYTAEVLPDDIPYNSSLEVVNTNLPFQF